VLIGAANGFCYVNDIVIAILALLQARHSPIAIDFRDVPDSVGIGSEVKSSPSVSRPRGGSLFPRVLYIDLDVHHGDAVQEAFYLNDRVFTLSFHHKHHTFFPGTGAADETGKGKGIFRCLNVPLHAGLGDSLFVKLVGSILTAVLKWFDPTVIVAQFGCDGLATDPFSKLNLTTKAFGACLILLQKARVPLLVLGGGGYHPPSVARCWVYLTALLARKALPEVVTAETSL
jgi:acetoin utilization deacetylase AcuC-like enzyme